MEEQKSSAADPYPISEKKVDPDNKGCVKKPLLMYFLNNLKFHAKIIKNKKAIQKIHKEMFFTHPLG